MERRRRRVLPRLAELGPILVLLIVAGLAAAPRADAFGLLPPTNVTAGTYSFGMVAADFDGDGVQDLAATDTFGPTYAAGTTLSVVLGDGDGSFGTPVKYTAVTHDGTQPTYLAVGDFDGKNGPDLAVVVDHPGGGWVYPELPMEYISVLLNDGHGAFGSPVGCAVMKSAADEVAVGDVNGDGKLDLVVDSTDAVSDDDTAVTVSVLLGNGDGTFQAAKNTALGRTAQTDQAVPSTYVVNKASAVAVRDFNGDGKADVAVAECLQTWWITDFFNVAGCVDILLSKGDGTFEDRIEVPTGISPWAIAVGDVEGDGRPDLVVANNSDSGYLSVLLGNADGTFTPEAPVYGIAANALWLAATDFDGDGHLDVAVVSRPVGASGTAWLQLLRGRGNGSFTGPQNIDWSNHASTAIAAADFDGDDRPDVAVNLGFADDPLYGYVSILLQGCLVGGSVEGTPAHGTISPEATQTVAYGGSQKFTFAPAAHYHVEWVKAGETTVTPTPETSTTVGSLAADTHVTVKYAIDTFEVEPSVVGGHGTISPETTQTVPWGGSQKFTFDPDDDYAVKEVKVGGVRVTPTPASEYTVTNVTSDTGISVEYERVYDVVPSVDGGVAGHGTISPDTTQTAAYGGSADFAFDPDDHYHVEEVRVGGTAVDPTPESTCTVANVTADTTIAVRFAIDTFTVTAAVVGDPAHGRISPSGEIAAEYGDTPAFTFSPDPGCHVEEVRVGGTAVTPVPATGYTFPPVDDDQTLSVTFAANLKPSVGVPRCPMRVRRGRQFEVSGRIRPEIPPGGASVTLTAYRRDGRRWQPVASYAAAAGSARTGSRYSATLALSATGSYRFIASTTATSDWLAERSLPSSSLVVVR